MEVEKNVHKLVTYQRMFVFLKKVNVLEDECWLRGFCKAGLQILLSGISEKSTKNQRVYKIHKPNQKNEKNSNFQYYHFSTQLL